MKANRFSKVLFSLLMSLVLLVPLLTFSSCSAGGGLNLGLNQPPEISNLAANPEQVNTADSTKVSCEARDPDRDPISYTWTASGGTVSGSGASVDWKAPDQAGDYTITVVVADGKGGQVTKQVTVNVVSANNSPPFIKKLTYEPNRYEIYDDEKVTFTCIAVDPDGDKITYHWEVDGGKIDPQGDGSIGVWTTPIELNAKEHMMTVYVTDSSGARSTKQFVTLKILCDCYREGAPMPGASPTPAK